MRKATSGHGQFFLAIAVLWTAAIVLLVRATAEPPMVQAGACQYSPCDCSTSAMGSCWTGPGGGSCCPQCNDGDASCGCSGGGWVGDCGGGSPPPPPCVGNCSGKVCGEDNGCGTACGGPTAGDGICCPQEAIGKAGYKCQDCSTCGNLKNDGLAAGCFCDNVKCAVGGRP